VYSATPSPSLNPQLRQNRNSLGMTEWQLEQAVTLDIAAVGNGNSGFCDIANPPILVLGEEYTTLVIRQTASGGCILGTLPATHP
jgi:hypothetical protein